MVAVTFSMAVLNPQTEFEHFLEVMELDVNVSVLDTVDCEEEDHTVPGRVFRLWLGMLVRMGKGRGA